MRGFIVASILWVGFVSAYPQQAVDPAYLRQYYQQIAQAAGAQNAAQGRADATPIYEQGAQEQQHIPQYLPQAQQAQRPQYQQPQARQYQAQPQYQPQQIQYVQEQQYQQPQPQLKVSKPRPQQFHQGGQRQQEEEDKEDYDPNPSYQFGFDVKDDEFTNYQNRKETRDGNVIKGSYSVVDSDGFIRTVTYTADPKEGFKAEVSRQPTDIVVKIPTPAPQSAHERFASQPQSSGAYRVQQAPQQQQAQPRPRPQEYSQYQ
ncbi:activating signal cointegrator 1 complex subunit 2 homolog [Anopheles ziemanni]|uniref:activating signal cointegrator 1 complex subunit 2 homolog n=1 Tax=Anopheles coustani TaxID=139045 RepID=UPI00265B0C6D|nr:activating signal cointegrator 1 complex subunit 2 homolog [Anopheles coustani]XP_058167013.1 activating signal cointegrator 1 complex subunit 2 homolog [Anopheles ziemanni]